MKRLGRRRHSLCERPSTRVMECRVSANEPTWGLRGQAMASYTENFDVSLLRWPLSALVLH